MSAIEKVEVLEQELSSFRDDVNMKLNIMLQMMTERNEHVKVQKELLTREQALYNTLLGNWKNSTGLVATEDGVVLIENNTKTDDEDGTDPDYELESNGPGPTNESAKKSKSWIRRQRNSGKRTSKQTRDINVRKPGSGDGSNNDPMNSVQAFQQEASAEPRTMEPHPTHPLTSVKLKTRSLIWMYYDYETTDDVFKSKCNVSNCGALIFRCTTNMRNHLKQKHNVEFQLLIKHEEEKKNKKVPSSGGSPLVTEEEIEPLPFTIVSSRSLTTGSSKCTVCGTTFSQDGYLETHMKSHK